MLLLALLQAAPAPPPAPPAPPAPWTVITKTNSDGSVLSATAAARSRDGTARLAVRCDRAAVAVVSLQFRLAGRSFAADNGHGVSVTIDGAPPIDSIWEFRGIAAVMSEPEAVTDLTVAIAPARQITVATSDSGAPVAATFDGPNGTSAVRDVLSACGYVLGTVPEPVKPVAK